MRSPPRTPRLRTGLVPWLSQRVRWLGLSLLLATCGAALAQSTGPGNALSLDGTNGYVAVPSGTWFGGDFTIEGWVYARSYNSWSRLLDFANGPYTNGVYLALSSGTTGLPTLGVLNSSSSPTLSASAPLPLNQWVHLAATLSGTTATLYLNGVAVGSRTLEVPPSVLRTNNYIGRSAFAGDGYANALFDEVRLWKVARTPAQLQAWMHRSLVGNEPGLAGYWRLDEGAGLITADSTGSSAAASLLGGATWTNSTVPMMSGAGSALNFNAALGQAATIPHQAAFDTLPLTVMCWFMVPTNNTGGGGAFVNKYVSSSYNGYQIFLGGQLKAWYWRDSADAVNGLVAGPVNDGAWHHTALVVDSTSGRLYLDGVLKSTVPWAGTPGPVTATTPVSLGVYQGDSFLNGAVDEVSIWNTALNAGQIQAAMNHPLSGGESGLVGYWRLDEGSGTNILDSSGHGYNGSLGGNPPTWIASGAHLVVPDPGYAVNLAPASSQYLQAPSGIWFSNDFSVEGWVYARSYTSWSRLLDFADGPNTNLVYLALSAGTTGLPTMGVFTNNNGTPILQSSKPLPLNQWTHLAATLSGTTGTIYINGNPVATGTLNVPPAVLRTNNFFGRSNYSADGYADALFDELRIWSVARTQTQVQQDMGGPLTGREPGLVGYWRLDEGTGTTAVDATGNGNNLTLVNAPLRVNGSQPAIQTLFSGITHASQGSLAFGDMNNDGLMDVLLTGSGATDGTETWQNQGTNTFTQVANGMSGQGSLYYSCAQWGDYDNDGKLDILVIGTQFGSTSTGITQVWHNQGNGTFANLGLPITGCLSGSVAWGDFDHDGRLDFIFCGYTGSGPVTQLWHNQGNGSFVKLSTSLPGAQFGSVALADFNNDGYLDILLTGNTTGGDVTQVWLNQGNGTFTNLPVALPGVYYSSVAVADFNNDGRPDILLCGQTQGGSLITQLWQNLGNGTFSNLNLSLPGVFQGAVAWGDYDADGYPDILLTGGSAVNSGNPANPITQVWHNQRNGTFTNLNANLPGLYSSAAAWGDYNNNGRPGFALSGLLSPGNYTTLVYQVTAPLANSPPTPPSGLQASPSTNGVLLTWNAATDLQTPTPGLSYNVRLGTNAGGFNLVSPQANAATGLRLLPQVGNAQQRLSYQFSNALALGTTYYWSVQAIDSGYAGSAFAVEGQFVVGGPTVLTGPAGQIQFTTANVTGSVNPNGYTTGAWFQYGATTNYGMATAVMNLAATNATAVGLTNTLSGLQAGTLYHYRLVATNSFGQNRGADFTFTTPAAVAPSATTTAATGLPFTPTLNGLVAPNGADTTVWFQWGTTTNYGNLTPTSVLGATNLATVAVASALAGLPAQLYHFQLIASNSAGVTLGGDQTFSLPAVTNLPSSLPGNSFGSLAWGDFNNDGLPDLLVTGQTQGNSASGFCQLWQNLGNGTFSNLNVSLPGLSASGVAWGDFDNDGYLDLLLTGQDTSNNPLTQIWHNNGDGTFTQLISASLPGVYNSAVALADFNRDGKLDILLSGMSGSGLISQIWLNNGDGTFSQANVALPGLQSGAVAVGDLDRDGWPDLVLTGISAGGRLTQVWHNNGDGTFTQLAAGVPNAEYGGVALADFDSDGWPDLLLSGAAGSVGVLTDVWHNNHDGTFTPWHTALPGVYYSSVAAGDFDNDGLPDILLNGTTDGTPGNAVCQLWRNLGNGSFTNFPVTLPGAWFGTLACADLNGDGRLDFAVSGFDTNSNPQLLLWETTAGPTNAPPGAPAGLNALASASGVTLSWTPATDAQTPAAGLSYNVRVGTSPAGIQVLAPDASVATGLQRLPQTGNAGQALSIPLNHLTLGATYYWSVQAIDAGFAGSPFAAEASFVVGQPGVLTGPSVQLSSTSIGLTGTVNPNGFATAAWFQWGANTNYGNTTALTNLGAGTTALAVSNLVAGIPAGFTWHYRLVASNSFGLGTGQDAIFKTPTAPNVATLAASGTVPTSTTLNGAVQPDAATTLTWFVYGSTVSYGSTSAPVVVSGTNNLPVTLTNLLTGLTPGVTYHFQLLATNLAGPGAGGDRTVTTPAPSVPSVTTLAASGLTPNRATLSGSVAPNGAATAAWFQWGTTTGFGNNTGLTAVNATNLSALSYSNALSGLAGSTLYYYRAVATNSAGTNFGATASFTTLPVTAPTAVTLPAAINEPAGATLAGSVNPNGADTTVWFAYGTTTNYGSLTGTSLVSSNNAAAIPISSLISGLTQNTVYHFQVLASNRVGVVTGGDQSLVVSSLSATSLGLPAVSYSSVAWADYNNDGRLDFLLAGQQGTTPLTGLWQNQGNGTFSNITVGLPGVFAGATAWGDYDNDGYLDLLLTGTDAQGNPQTQLWHNNGDGSFTRNTSTAWTPLQYSSAAWGDYDNDGKPDLLLSGADAGFQALTQLWHNNGDGSFRLNTNANFTGVLFGAATWADYDGDGRLDVLVAGYDNSFTPQCQLWRNQGDGSFLRVTNAPFPGLVAGAVAWGDYDQDGRPDLLLTGLDANNVARAQLWHNNGDGSFTQNTNLSLPGVFYSAATWGDLDGDGAPDILLTGVDATQTPLAQVWHNNRDGTFTQMALGLPPAFDSALALGDALNNGKLDVLLSGFSAFDTNGNPVSPFSQLLLNYLPVSNSPPTAPSGLAAAAQGSQVQLSWNAASDAQTPAAGLSYNLRVGTTPGGSDVLAPAANPTTGFRRLAQTGNAQQHLSATLTQLRPGTYYWSVQAVDAGFAGSPFAPEATFSILAAAPLITSAGLGAGGQFQVRFNAVAGGTYTLQASSNLTQWVNLTTTNTPATGNCVLLDPYSPSVGQKFYRLRVP